MTNQILVIATGKQALIMRSNMEYKTEGPVKSTGTSILVNDIEFMFYSASCLNKDPLIIYLMHLDECFVVDEEPLTEEVIETIHARFKKPNNKITKLTITEEPGYHTHLR